MTEPQLTLPDRVGVVNVGLSLFADAIREQGAPVISVDWRVPAGGQPDAVAALGRLYGIHADRIEAANAEVLHRLDTGTSGLLVAARTAAAFAVLSHALKEGRLDKRYLLLCAAPAAAQPASQAQNPAVQVAYTLAVDPTGLPSQEYGVLSDAKSKGVNVSVRIDNRVR